MTNYYIRDSHTGLLIGGCYKTRKAAQRTADRLDLAYGAVRFVVIFGA